jgi:hypothetical protein
MRFARLTGALCLALALGRVAAAEEPTWIVDGEGRRFRVSFDPGQRLYVGASLIGNAGTSFDAVAEVALALRAPPPPVGAPVFWKRDHELAHLLIRPGGDGVWLEGRLYRGIFLRHSREGSLTIPVTPPLRLSLPFDVGVRVEVGRVSGTWPLVPEATLEAGVVRGEAMADLLRSEHPGRWVALGVVGSYDVGFKRQEGRLLRDHRVTPLAAVAASAHAESARGLFAGGLRAEWGRVWSSRDGWGQELRLEGELEVTPVAVNDLPLSFVLGGRLEVGQAWQTPRFRTFAGVRVGVPL